MASAALLAGTMAMAGSALPASAVPVYEITGAWEEGTPSIVSDGDVVNAIWHVNVNDDAPAPSNDPVDDVTFTATTEHGVFAEVPSVCLVDGVEPISSISDDGRTLVCNLGTLDQGTAAAILTPIRVDGVTGDEVVASGEIAGQRVDLTPIPITNPFGMDIRWEQATSRTTWGEDTVDFDFEWTLFLDAGSEPGPDSVSYTLDVSAATGEAIVAGADLCTPFTGAGATGHPWSGASAEHPERVAPFVDDCTLTQAAPGAFELTLTGIDYSLVQVPTHDSTGRPLPTDSVAVASGSIWLTKLGTQNSAIELSASTPTYVAPGSGATDVDDAENNGASRQLVRGSWSNAWRPEYSGVDTGSWWSNLFEVAPGTPVESVNTNTWSERALPGTTAISQCVVLDTRYLAFESARLERGWGGTPYTQDDGLVLEYWTGPSTLLDPASGSYDPNAFSCATEGGWTTEPPADLTGVRAVRARYPFSMIAGGPQHTPLRVEQRVAEDVEVGQDIWQWGSIAEDGTWSEPNRSTDPADVGNALPTPGLRYPFIGNGRDVVRIIAATPAIAKSVDRSVVAPGEPAVYTLEYSANGTGAIPETVDDFEIVDTLPVGMEYVAGSAAPEPSVSTNGDGAQVLTWTLDGVPTNAVQALTYQAMPVDVDPGSVLENTATASVGGATSQPATAQVTVTTSGTTSIGKTPDSPYIPNPDGSGSGEGSWTVTIASDDPVPQAFTDTIDILPYLGDDRGTSFSGSYELTGVEAVDGAVVYYTTADPATLSDDPADPSNGSAGDAVGNTVGWTTTFTPDATAVRVIAPELAPGATQQFVVGIVTEGMDGGDVLVNRAQARAEHTELVMRTSAPITIANTYSAALKKYVLGTDGEWHDANTVEDYPLFQAGDTIRYRIVVENTGQGTLTNVEVSDDRQPELGSFTVDELEPGASEAHELEIELTDGVQGPVVNTACATADQPADAEQPPTINCDPAGFEVDGTPVHEKSLLSATPVGDGLWEVVYAIDVTNSTGVATSYSLDDELHFTEQASVVAAEVTEAPDGVELADPAWDGQDSTRIATAVPLAGNGDADYAPHRYVLAVVASVPLSLEGAGSPDDPTACGDSGDDSDRAFNNVSTLTGRDGRTQDDQACAELPSITIDKSLVGEVESDGDSYAVTYAIDVTNAGAAAGVYSLFDQLRFDPLLAVEDVEVTNTDPGDVTTSGAFTGLGTEPDAAANAIATDVDLAAGATHRFLVHVSTSLAPGERAQDVSGCADGDQAGGLRNVATVQHNGLEAQGTACAPIAVPPAPPASALPSTGFAPDATLPAVALLLMAIGSAALAVRRRVTR